MRAAESAITTRELRPLVGTSVHADTETLLGTTLDQFK